MPRILVIEDDAPTRIMLRHVLERAGHQIVEAPNGKVGISLYREKPADLIIADMFMPEVDGIETITKLRQDYPDVKIIAMSGGARIGPDACLRAAENLGALQSLTKPFGKSDLLKVVQKVLG